MMTDKEQIRRALLGDKEAQQECTDRGIVLQCPFCGMTPGLWLGMGLVVSRAVIISVQSQ